MKKGAAHLPPPSLQVASPRACFGSKLLATGDLMVLTRVGLVEDVNTQILFRLSPPLHPSDQGQLLRIADMLCKAFTLLCFTSPETASQVMSLWRVSSTCGDTTPLAATAAQSPGPPARVPNSFLQPPFLGAVVCHVSYLRALVSDWLAIATLPNPQTRIMAGPCWVLMWLAVALNRYPADPSEVCGCDTQLLVMLCWLINWLRFVVIGGQSLARYFLVQAVSLSAATLAVLCTLLCWLI